MSAPVLVGSLGFHAAWSYGGTEPTWWIVETSADGVSGWTEYLTVSGSTYGLDVDSGFYYRVTGLDGALAPVTPDSNVEFIGF